MQNGGQSIKTGLKKYPKNDSLKTQSSGFRMLTVLHRGKANMHKNWFGDQRKESLKGQLFAS
jgi:hypothetical protein